MTISNYLSDTTDYSLDTTMATLYQHQPSALQPLYVALQEELTQLEHYINEQLKTEVSVIYEASRYLIDAGGKRIRPMLFLAFAKMLSAPIKPSVQLAAVVEFIHSATLLHDDVVDDAQIRRGLDSTNHRFGNAVSVLVGDFLYSRAFQMMVQVNQLDVMGILSEATNTIAKGEVIQLMNINNLTLTREVYQNIIYCKTAKLFEASSELAVALAFSQNPAYPASHQKKWRQCARNFGKHLGYAFQLSDDALDYVATPQQSGKEYARDLQEGKVTFPLLLALEQSTLATPLKEAIENNHDDKLSLAIEAIAEVDGITATLSWADQEIEQARDCLRVFPDSPLHELLHNLCQFVRIRQS